MRWGAPLFATGLFSLASCFGTYVPVETGGSTTDTAGTAGTATGATEAKVDILIMVDRRPEVEVGAAKVLPAFFQAMEEFTASLNAISSYNVGVTSMEHVPDNLDPECRGIGSLFRAEQPLIPPNEMMPDCETILRGRRYLSSDVIPESDLQPSLECLLSGTAYDEEDSRDPRPIDAMFAVLDDAANGPGGCNEGFFRPDAGLVVILVTDRDSTEREDLPAEWITKLVAKQQSAAGNIGLVMIVGLEGATGTTGGDTDGPECQATEATNLLAFAEFRDDDERATADFCDQEAINEAFLKLAETIIPTVSQPRG